MHGFSELFRVADIQFRRQLRSAVSTLELDIPPKRRVSVSDGAFEVAAARVWNGQPSNVIAPRLQETAEAITRCLTISVRYVGLHHR